jgi:hypothetical protein
MITLIMLKRLLSSPGGLLTALFFFGGLGALYSLIMPKAPKALADPAEPSAVNVVAAEVILEINRFEDDGGKQYL